MFFECFNLYYLDISKFNLENLINADSMFRQCNNLKEIEFNNNTRTNNLQEMSSMFL